MKINQKAGTKAGAKAAAPQPGARISKPAALAPAPAPDAMDEVMSAAAQGSEPNRARVNPGRAEVRPLEVREAGVRPNSNFGDEDSDDMTVPQHLIPHGHSVEWKRVSIFGQPDRPSHLIKLRQNGWEPASMTDFAEMMPPGWGGDTIERDGMMLMIRPTEYSELSRAFARKQAIGQVKSKLSQMGETGSGEFERKASVNRSHAPVDEE